MMKLNLFKYIFGTLLVLAFTACTYKPENATQVNKIPAIYPDYTGVTIPVDIAPLNFAMADDSFDKIYVTVKGSKGGKMETSGDYADFDIEEWHQLLSLNKGGKLIFSVSSTKDGNWLTFKDFTVEVSSYDLGEWGVIYRRVVPGYEMYSEMGIYQRNLSSFDETPILRNTQLDGACLNCHTSNQGNQSQFVFHVRGVNGCTFIHHNGKDEVLAPKNEELGGSMVYPGWHPSGRYCAFSTNKTSQMFHFKGPKRIEVYDSSSDVFVYDVKEHKIIKDTLTMKKLWAENTPAFSSDGKWLYFTTARRQVYPDDFDKEKYSLCRIGFDATKGCFVGNVDTLIQADRTGKSVTWPRPSADGRYIMYTQINYGYFSIWHPEADLYLLDLKTKETHPVHEVNSKRTESYHNWSTNSHWFLFTSRRDDGLYTRLYFSSIDSNGKATKPFLLPQRDPKRYYTRSLYSYNTPEFSKRRVDADERTMGGEIRNPHRIEAKISK